MSGAASDLPHSCPHSRYKRIFFLSPDLVLDQRGRAYLVEINTNGYMIGNLHKEFFPLKKEQASSPPRVRVGGKWGAAPVDWPHLASLPCHGQFPNLHPSPPFQAAVGSFTGASGFPLQHHYRDDLAAATTSFCQRTFPPRGCPPSVELELCALLMVARNSPGSRCMREPNGPERAEEGRRGKKKKR